MSRLKIIECPRDAMQGIKDWIPTEIKIKYINKLLQIGFDTLDMGSFVSPKAIPQMADTAEVLDTIDWRTSPSKLLTIIANTRGAVDACKFEQIRYLGFPFSLSETFQQRNTHKSMQESFEELNEIQNLCIENKKELVVYFSMGFGNPYGDVFDTSIIKKWAEKMQEIGVGIISMADTIGIAEPKLIEEIFTEIIPAFPEVEWGAHFHSTAASWQEKISTAYRMGCRRFDGALKGYGGCPFAKDDLVGNVATELILGYFESIGEMMEYNHQALLDSLHLSQSVFHEA